MSVFLKMCTSGEKIETFSPQKVKIFFTSSYRLLGMKALTVITRRSPASLIKFSVLSVRLSF